VGEAGQAEATRRYDVYRDEYYSEPVNFNLQHLTLSEEAVRFFKEDERLRKLVPLVDQVMATNKLDDRAASFYKYLADSLIIRLIMFTSEDDPGAHIKLHTARAYMYQLIDGARGGYRGRLATEIRRVYRTEESEPKRRRGWLW